MGDCTKMRMVHIVFHCLAANAEVYGVFPSQDAAAEIVDSHRGWSSLGRSMRADLRIIPRSVDKRQLEDLIKENLTDDQFSRNDWRS